MSLQFYDSLQSNIYVNSSIFSSFPWKTVPLKILCKFLLSVLIGFLSSILDRHSNDVENSKGNVDVIGNLAETNNKALIELNDRSLTSENGKHEIRVCQDSANNNENKNDCEKKETEDLTQKHVTLDALEHSKIAVAQFAAAALAKGANENSVKDLTMLQSALFTLQHQQVFQMQLIEQLQFQLAKSTTKKDKTETKSSENSKDGDRIGEDQTDDISDDVFVESGKA